MGRRHGRRDRDPIDDRHGEEFVRHRGAVLAWNALGTLDLISAAALGLLSAPGSPLQIFGGSIGSIAITSLPWSNIPTLIVPFYLIMHGVIFARLAGARARSAS